ncbi:transmembrane protein 234 homolog [Ostrinia nubilalis]|uniref:transmembrane protein 234 homolog n=1 Tax=Ostrinia nubilalis TaxID=29057 RepID=UPI0030824947
MLSGLLVLTGALWGCTNPFIRQGTKGLRDVRAKGWLGQAVAEVSFLLGNWRYVMPWLVNQSGSLAYLAAVQRAPLAWYQTYVVPWLVNQSGSLAYLAAVQRAPLSLAVPAANSLAFAFTAVVGAAVGAEEPLDKGSILGVVLIVAGTALCCLDKTS